MSGRTSILFLAHRIPYPPDKGDKIRSWNILRHLSKRHTLHLACFVEDPDDWNHVHRLEELCGQTHFAPIERAYAAARSLFGVLRGEPFTLPYYRDDGMSAWIRELVTQNTIDCCYVFSSAMAQYAMLPACASVRRIMDFVDVDSEKWREYGARRPWPRSFLYRREGRKLLAYDRLIARAFDASLFVSAAEATLFAELAPECRDKLQVVANGVDSSYFDPDRDYQTPYSDGRPALVFTGAMDYWPNAEAAIWFAGDVLPLIRETVPGAHFYVVGMAPPAAVRRLERLPGVTVTGRVPDVRPYLAHASAVVAPLRLARGVQNKVLEAMAMGRPVAATPQALEGLEVEIATDVLAAADAPGFAHSVVSILNSDAGTTLGRRAREKVLRRYDWAVNLGRIEELIDGD